MDVKSTGEILIIVKYSWKHNDSKVGLGQWLPVEELKVGFGQ
jgi:hypothetical protein